jgi:drug/metabolite transporter (DMT)-like permease
VSGNIPPSAVPASRRGALYGLLAAALFGLSTPLAKALLQEVSPQLLAGLLYLGAAGALCLWRAASPATREAPLGRTDAATLCGIVAAGGIAGPLLMLVGLQRVSAVAGSLLLNLEGLFTIGLAVLVFREHVGRYGALAAVLILAGAAVVKLDIGPVRVDGWGVTALALACLAWALDNNLTQRLSLRDPCAIVQIKTLAAGAFNFGLALVRGDGLPDAWLIAAALLLGTVSYGLSVVLDAYALRLVGAAREAMYFATAPFVGAIAAALLLREELRAADILAMALMALGVAALLKERHSHPHAHDPIEHDHLHEHDAHHQHEHLPGDIVAEPHAHPHRHAALVHDHPHLADAHHRHRH